MFDLCMSSSSRQSIRFATIIYIAAIHIFFIITDTIIEMDVRTNLGYDRIRVSILLILELSCQCKSTWRWFDWIQLDLISAPHVLELQYEEKIAEYQTLECSLSRALPSESSMFIFSFGRVTYYIWCNVKVSDTLNFEVARYTFTELEKHLFCFFTLLSIFEFESRTERSVLKKIYNILKLYCRKWKWHL